MNILGQVKISSSNIGRVYITLMWIRIVVQVPWPSLNNHLIHHIRIQDRIQLPGVVSNGRKVKVWYCINTIQKVFRYRMNILRVCNLDRQVKQRYYPLTAELVFHSWSGRVIVIWNLSGWCVSGQWRMMLVSVGETPVANRRTMVQFHSSSLKKKLQQVLWEWKFLRTFASVLWNKGSGPFYMVIDQSIVIPWWCSWQTMSKPRK